MSNVHPNLAGTKYFVSYLDGEPLTLARITDGNDVWRVTRKTGGWEEYPALVSLIWRPDSHMDWNEIDKAEADRIYPILVAQAEAAVQCDS